MTPNVIPPALAINSNRQVAISESNREIVMTSEAPCVAEDRAARPTAFDQLVVGVLRLWNSVSGHGFAILIALWTVVCIPSALFRGYHYVEGLTVTIAQSALEGGNWLTPHLFNIRWIERPTLLSWFIATISYPMGHVYPFVARLPVILSVLFGAFLIWKTLRAVANTSAALLGAAAFLACPIVIRYYATSVADVPLAVILFSAFLLWWKPYSEGRISIWNWLSVGGLMAVAALLKGPQPVAYVTLGILAFLIITSDWSQLRGLMLANVVAAIPLLIWYANVFVPGDQSEWLRYTRLSPRGLTAPHPLFNAIDFYFEVFPTATLFTAYLLTVRRQLMAPGLRRFVLALSCYALAGTAMVLIWPAEVNPRYILPMTLPLGVLAGISYDQLVKRQPIAAATAVCVVVGLLGYAAQHALVDAVATPAYAVSRTSGSKIAALIKARPAPLYRTTWDGGLNELPYVPQHVSTIDPRAVSSLPKPAWVIVPADEEHKFMGLHVSRFDVPLKGSVLLRLE